MFYDLHNEHQYCDIGIYLIENISDYRYEFWFDYFCETMDNTDELNETNFMMIFSGKTFPYTSMLQESKFYKNIVKFGNSGIHERNL